MDSTCFLKGGKKNTAGKKTVEKCFSVRGALQQVVRGRKPRYRVSARSCGQVVLGATKNPKRGDDIVNIAVSPVTAIGCGKELLLDVKFIVSKRIWSLVFTNQNDSFLSSDTKVAHVFFGLYWLKPPPPPPLGYGDKPLSLGGKLLKVTPSPSL